MCRRRNSYVGTPDDRTGSNRQTAYLSSTPCYQLSDVPIPTMIGPTFRILFVPTATKRCHYINLPMALLIESCNRSFLSLLSFKSDLIKGLLVYSYLPTRITFT